jgi:Domain of unknown function (DUF4188)
MAEGGIDRGILRDRAMAKTEGKRFVVFLIGMRVNNFWAVRRWTRVAMAMRPMLKELYQHPEMGFLSGEPMFSWRGITMVQYWRSAEELQAYANARGSTHFPAWREFYRRVGKDGSVGIWHETYVVEPGAVESIYVNMPLWGLTQAFGRETVAQNRDTARQRLEGGERCLKPD